MIMVAHVFGGVSVVLAALFGQPGGDGVVACTGPDGEAVAAATAGDRPEANAAWWGFNGEDATDCLQAAIRSGAGKLVVPYMGRPWIVRPLKLASNQEIVFEPGVVLLAKEGEYKGKGDSMLSAASAHDILLRGYGATLRMRKKDYQSAAYEKAEWRMTIDLASCSRVQILGLRLESSGGDGIYVGVARTEQPYCEDVLIRDVVCDDHHRQGISVISAVNLLIENCVLSNTDGTAPGAGIDFEPNSSNEKIVNCVVRNCAMENNAGAGVLVYLKNLARESDPVSLIVEDCYVRSGRDVGLAVGAIRDDGPEGAIEFRNCVCEGTRGGLFVYDKSAEGARVRFVNCHWKNAGGRRRGKISGAPFLLSLLRREITEKNGGIDFVDCGLYDGEDRPVLKAEDNGRRLGIHDIQGLITVHSPYAPRVDYRCKAHDCGLSVVGAAE
ncbi:MAG TPA: right-handed parallel beta-helix repeat-containing protein [Candidatus Hydrogenedentes bacterium]|nr:right-handed parallel beta-helix repeat-containing protein [Candidatus Hydrogenedentota bacterium]HPG65793.1 right-handed parallel beta-helix repeat-containing protein [Candidatus Hydrogenedentota bacterium]